MGKMQQTSTQIPGMAVDPRPCQESRAGKGAARGREAGRDGQSLLAWQVAAANCGNLQDRTEGEDYRKELVPLIVPVTLIPHCVRKHPVPDWVHRQVCLNPYHKEMMLRNQV
jgi:hypothetical protein